MKRFSDKTHDLLLRLILAFNVLGGRLRTRRPLDHLAQLVDVHGNARQERHADLNRHVGGVFAVLIAKAARFDNFSSKRSQRRACDVVVEGGVKTAVAVDSWASTFGENVICGGGLLILFRRLWRVGDASFAPCSAAGGAGAGSVCCAIAGVVAKSDMIARISGFCSVKTPLHLADRTP